MGPSARYVNANQTRLRRKFVLLVIAFAQMYVHYPTQNIAVLRRKSSRQKVGALHELRTQNIGSTARLRRSVAKRSRIAEVIGVHNLNALQSPLGSCRRIAANDQIIGLVVGRYYARNDVARRAGSKR